MNFWVVVANDGHRKRAIVCEERALAWVRGEMRTAGFSGLHVDAYPAETHWTARVVSTDPAPDFAQEGWLGEGP